MRLLPPWVDTAQDFLANGHFSAAGTPFAGGFFAVLFDLAASAAIRALAPCLLFLFFTRGLLEWIRHVPNHLLLAIPSMLG